MSKKSLAVLAIITLVIVGAAWYLTEQRLPKTELAKRPLYPELLNRVNDIARIEVKTKDQDTVLVKQGEQWVIENRSRYPALFEKVKGAVLAIANLEILEGKTKNKELYPRLGVEDIGTEGASSRQVVLLDQGGQPLAALIVGKKRTATSGRGIPAFYVRKADEPQAFLVKGALEELPEKPIDWTDQSLLNIDAKRIRAITIEPPGQGPLQIHRKDAGTQDFTLDNILKGTKLKSQTVLNGLASTLEFLQFEDVVARASFTPPPNPTVTTLRTFDGLIAKVTTANLNDKAHVSFEFAYDAETAAQAKETPATEETKPSADAAAKPTASNQPATAETPKTEAKPSVEEEAAKLNEKTRDWVYVLPGYKATLLTKTLSDLTAPEPKAEEAKKEEETKANEGGHPKPPAETPSIPPGPEPQGENPPAGP
ncbi:MAG TPA: DUF4340 domain-containing protein [Gammaproteobacteria bacterium]|nr:DUF4340 domain-containing protein [Gammaproteobacteria bacterium]